jgi:hypothetical protein
VNLEIDAESKHPLSVYLDMRRSPGDAFRRSRGSRRAAVSRNALPNWLGMTRRESRRERDGHVAMSEYLSRHPQIAPAADW